MAKREISNLDLKIKLLNEYLRNGGVEKIPSPQLIRDITDIKFSDDEKADPDSISSRVRAFMGVLFFSHLSPPVFHPESSSEYQSTLQKSLSFDQENIDTPEQFDKIYDEFKDKSDILFRGQREAKWRLYSNLQRTWLNSQLYKSEESYQKLIQKMVDMGNADFSTQITALLGVNHVDATNSVNVLGYLQHHGCPTPLLDWTYKFQNALYFAIDGLTPNPGTVEIEDYCSVYYIEEKNLEEGSMRSIIEVGIDDNKESALHFLIEENAKGDEERIQSMKEHFAGRNPFDESKFNGSGLISYITEIERMMQIPITYFSDKDINSFILFSLNNSSNIKNQVGVFIWNSDPSKPLEMVGEEEYHADKPADTESNYRFCNCFNIHKKLTEHIRARLEQDGITKEFIYPTPDISTKEVFEKCKSN